RGVFHALFLPSPMGLEMVELVMETEERFGVQLPDEDCSRVRSVADLANLVVSRLDGTGSSCRTSQTFYRVRRALVAAGLARTDIRPHTRWASLDRVRQRRAMRRLRSELPRLRTRTRRTETIGEFVRLITPSPLPKSMSERSLAEQQILER